MVTIITVKPEEMRTMSILKGNNKKLITKGNREEAIKRNTSIIKEYKRDIVKTAREA